MCTEGRPCEGTARRWTPASQAKRPQKKSDCRYLNLGHIASRTVRNKFL